MGREVRNGRQRSNWNAPEGTFEVVRVRVRQQQRERGAGNDFEYNKQQKKSRESRCTSKVRTWQKRMWMVGGGARAGALKNNKLLVKHSLAVSTSL